MYMARELLVFRHGKSDWYSDAVNDFDRPLARRGRKAVKRMAFWLSDQNLLPQRILCSPAERARQTALRLCRFAEIPESRIVWKKTIYAADLKSWSITCRAGPSKRPRVVQRFPPLRWCA